MMKHLTLLSFLLSWCAGFLACTEPPPRTLTLAERRLADSLFQEEVKREKPLLDSLCEQRFDSLVEVMLDSILDVRKKAMDKQLQRLRSELEKPSNQ